MGTAPSGWQNPKTNWGSADVVGPQDFNRIEGDISAIETGSRTVDPSQAPTGNSGSLRQLLDWFANRIRAILGTTNWYDAPPITLQALLNHKSRHATGGADALSPADIGAAPASHTHTPAQISPQGAGSGLNADLLRGYAPGTGAYAIVQRDGSGNIPGHATADALIATGTYVGSSSAQFIGMPFTPRIVFVIRLDTYTMTVVTPYAAVPLWGSTVFTSCCATTGGMQLGSSNPPPNAPGVSYFYIAFG